MQGKRLLERLRAIEENPHWRGDVDLTETLTSVLGHVQKILNTRQGTVPIAPEYGIPDFTSHASAFDPGAMPRLEKILAQIITRYEPRLEAVEVHFAPVPDKPVTLVFRLNARLRLKDSQLPVVFETFLCPDGHVEIVR